MAQHTEISWTHHTYNPWVGCSRVSPGCQHCYAELQADGLGRVAQWSKRKVLKAWGRTAPRYFPSGGAAQASALVRRSVELAASGVRERVFCASMADVFEAHPSIDLDKKRGELWDLIEATPNLDWLLLTKRPENIHTKLRPSWLSCPRENVWLGTTAEDQSYVDRRLPVLLQVPAAVHFVSCEPLLSAIDLARYLAVDGINWVIVGGESGKGYRAPQIDWVRSLRDQTLAAGQSFHFKQWGGTTPKAGGYALDGRTWLEFPIGAAPVVRAVLSA